MHQSTEHQLIGTVPYISPEQAAGLPVSPASDWYSFGTMLYEALTGERPFQGGPFAILLDKQNFEPPAPCTLVPGIPDDLDALCVDLLRRDPLARPLGHEVFYRLAGTPKETGAAISSPPSQCNVVSLVGRDGHLRAIAEAWEAVTRGMTVALDIRGRSGQGKTVLVQHFLDGLVQRDLALVLAGRCYERESVPYKALDNLVDALVRYMLRLSAHDARALIPRDVLSFGARLPRSAPRRGRGDHSHPRLSRPPTRRSCAAAPSSPCASC